MIRAFTHGRSPIPNGRITPMPTVKFTNLYLYCLDQNGNYAAFKQVTERHSSPTGDLGKKTVSLLRSLPTYGPDAILGRSSSLLPPSFAPGRFAAFLSSDSRA